MKRELFVNLNNLLLSLSEVVDYINPSVDQHQYRTAYIALELAKHSNADLETRENIFAAALLHDIGAITVEEKIDIHNFEVVNKEVHAIKGALLLDQVPWLSKLSKIVKHHHTEWITWNRGIDDPIVYSSQIILLADYVERLVDRQKYILHQTNDIMEEVKKISGTMVHEAIITAFIELAKKEEFWLDLVSSRLYSLLLNNGPFSNIQIGLDDVSRISDLYKDLIDFKSRFTATHTTGVAECAVKISEFFGMAEIDIKSMRIAGNFHDVGKLVIPNSILEKPDKLTKEEFAIIRCHTYYTYYTLNSIGGLHRIAEWAAYHHEKLDGSGYPFHCTKHEIVTGSRIMAVADIFTAIAEDRPYRIGMTRNDIYKVLTNQVENKYLDRRIVDVLFDNYDEIRNHVHQKQQKALEFYEKRFHTITEKYNLPHEALLKQLMEEK